MGIQKAHLPFQKRPWASKKTHPPFQKRPWASKMPPIRSWMPEGLSVGRRNFFWMHWVVFGTGECFFDVGFFVRWGIPLGFPWSFLRRKSAFFDAQGRFWDGDNVFWMPRVVFDMGIIFFGCPGLFLRWGYFFLDAQCPLRGPIADLCFWVVIKSELTGTNTSSGGVFKALWGDQLQIYGLGYYKIRIDWYKHQQRGFKVLKGPSSRCKFLSCHKVRIDWYKHQ